MLTEFLPCAQIYIIKGTICNTHGFSRLDIPSVIRLKTFLSRFSQILTEALHAFVANNKSKSDLFFNVEWSLNINSLKSNISW